MERELPPVVGSRLTLDIWHPDCWTLEVTASHAGGLLGHGVHTVEGRARGRFTVYADSMDGVESLVRAIRDSKRTNAVWATERLDRHHDPGTGGAIAPGSATRGIVVDYALADSINDALVSRGFIPDEPVRMYGGREYWTVLCHRDRAAIRAALDEIRATKGAEIVVDGVASLDEGLGSGMFTENALSARQHEVFVLARERGYYRWPRDVSAADLARELDLSKATLLEHLRKAEAKLLDPDFGDRSPADGDANSLSSLSPSDSSPGAHADH